MKAWESLFKFSKRLSINDVSPCNVTKFQKSTNCTCHFYRDIAFNGRQPDLHCLVILMGEKQKQKHTFIRAFESSPVHCLNPRPSENLLNPENGATRAILTRNNWYNKILRCRSLTVCQCHLKWHLPVCGHVWLQNTPLPMLPDDL